MTKQQSNDFDRLERLCELWDLLNRSQEYPDYYEEDEIKAWGEEHESLKRSLITDLEATDIVDKAKGRIGDLARYMEKCGHFDHNPLDDDNELQERIDEIYELLGG